MKVFFDMEFTGLHQNTTPISIGIISENGETFYAEFTDYDRFQVDDWIKENVIRNLSLFDRGLERFSERGSDWLVYGDKGYVSDNLKEWLLQFSEVEVWGDVLGYDWVLFCELFGGAFGLPENIYYIPFDIATLMKMKGVDPDIGREEFAEFETVLKHNSLFDAIVIMSCYNKLVGGI